LTHGAKVADRVRSNTGGLTPLGCLARLSTFCHVLVPAATHDIEWCISSSRSPSSIAWSSGKRCVSGKLRALELGVRLRLHVKLSLQLQLLLERDAAVLVTRGSFLVADENVEQVDRQDPPHGQYENDPPNGQLFPSTISFSGAPFA
jgi:hypothetical protein